MAEIRESYEIAVAQGEDLAVQMYWLDEYDAPVPITEPVLMDVVDAYRQVVLRFTTSTDPVTAPHITLSGQDGFMQFTCPKTVTSEMIPGRYACDIFAAVVDPAYPFQRQTQRVGEGTMVIERRISRVEDAQLLGLVPDEEVLTP